MNNTYNIVEIFNSIQGEGKFTGTNCTFVRFFDCNLKCNFCDEPKHKDSKLVTKMNKKEILSELQNFSTRHIVITGGEPSLYDLNGLIKLLKTYEFFVQVETNGFNLSNIDEAHWITLSPKTKNLPLEEYDETKDFPLRKYDELKILVDTQSQIDFEFLKKLNDYVYVYLQPINYETELNQDNVTHTLKLCKEYGLNFSLQLHKLLNIE